MPSDSSEIIPAGGGDATGQARNIAFVPLAIPIMFGPGPIATIIGMSPNITLNWKAARDNRFTLPVGLGVGKLVKLGKIPVKIQLQGQYSVIHPDDFGQRWNFQLQVTPAIPSLIKNVLLQ